MSKKKLNMADFNYQLEKRSFEKTQAIKSGDPERMRKAYKDWQDFTDNYTIGTPDKEERQKPLAYEHLLKDYWFENIFFVIMILFALFGLFGGISFVIYKMAISC